MKLGWLPSQPLLEVERALATVRRYYDCEPRLVCHPDDLGATQRIAPGAAIETHDLVEPGRVYIVAAEPTRTLP